MVVEVCNLLGVNTNNEVKVAYGPELDILGVHFNIAKGKLAVKDSRQKTLELEIRTALEDDRLTADSTIEMLAVGMVGHLEVVSGGSVNLGPKWT